MFSYFFGSSSSSSASKKRPREEDDEDAAELAATKAAEVEEEVQEDETTDAAPNYDEMYVAVIKKDDRDELFKLSLDKLKAQRSKYSLLFVSTLDSVIPIIKKHVPREEMANVKIAEDKLKVAKDTCASNTLSSFFFKYVSHPFFEDLRYRKVENIIDEKNFLAKIEGLLRENAADDSEEAYLELKEKVRGVFGVLLGHIQNIRSEKSSKKEDSEKDWQEVCDKLMKLFVLSVTIQFMEELLVE